MTPEAPPLEDAYEIATPGSAGINGEAIAALWRSEGAVREDAIDGRLREVRLVCTHADDGLVGVCTSAVGHIPRLGFPLHALRIFVAREHRFADIAKHLLIEAGRLHEEEWRSGTDRRAIGVAILLHNQAVQGGKREGRWPTTRLSLIGLTPKGAHLRVRYFGGAEIPAGAPVDSPRVP